MYECPLSYLTQDTIQVLNLVSIVKHTNTLLYDGGIAEQPYWLMEAISVDREEEALALQAKGK